MASQGSSQKVIQQDYIVRQRYENKLPPPPGDPKLLEIPTPGLDLYTAPQYGSRMHREQPLNIEADAFMGMPIDLVGMPGVFDGDESSIQAPLNPPTIHPKDKSLLRTLKQLKQGNKGESSDVTFLRRTQLIAEDRGRVDPGGARSFTTSVKRRKKETSDDDPMKMMRNTIKGFDIANPESAYKGPDNSENVRGTQPTPAELDAWKNPKHPSKPNLKVVDTYPLIPDLNAATDDHGFSVLKFSGYPPTDVKDKPDPRMQTALLHPLEPSSKIAAEYQAKVAAYKADPTNPEPGLPPLSYEFFMPKNDETAINLSRMFDTENPERNNSELYNNASDGGENDSFRYNHSRIYDPGHQLDHRAAPYKEVALALHDPELEKKRAKAEGEGSPHSTLAKAAYYYPLTHMTQLKPRRAKSLAQIGMQVKIEEDDEEKIDNLDVIVREPADEEEERRTAYNVLLDTQDAVEADADGEADAEPSTEA